MATFSGTAGTVSSTGGNVIADVKEWSLDVSHNIVDTTSFGKAWTDNIAAIRSYSGSFSANTSDDSIFENQLVKMETGENQQLAIRLYLDGSNYFQGTILYTGIATNTDYSGNAQTSFNFTGKDSDLVFVSS